MNETTQHTPGPWHQTLAFAGEDRKSVEKIYLSGKGRNSRESICRCYGEHAADNARLIAAAPDLLAALMAIHEAGRTSDQSRAIWCAEIARAAIAKAKEATQCRACE